MRILRIVQLLYEALRNLPISIQRLCRHPYSNVSQQAVQITTAVVPKCRLRQSSPIGVVYCHAQYRNCTPTVRGTTGSPNLCTRFPRAFVWQHKSAKCTDPYTGCTKYRLRQSSPLGVV